MKKSKLLAMLFALILALGILSSFTYSSSAQDVDEKKEGISLSDRLNERIYSDATLDDEFCPHSIIVVLDESTSNISGLAKSRTDQLFNGINTRSVTDLSGTTKPEERSPELKKHFEKTAFRQILHVELAQESKQNVLDVIKRLEKTHGILYAGPNYIVSVSPIDSNEEETAIEVELLDDPMSSNPNDPSFNNQWGLIGENGIDASNAWGVTTGSNMIRVGVIDTGVANHVDLNDNVVAGWDFFNDNSTTSDDTHGHGTHVAGIIGAIGNNNIGISGVAQAVSITPLQSSNEENLFFESTRIDAIRYARDLWGTSQQISIINHSVGTFGQSVGLLNAISQYPGLFVWSAGNETEHVNDFLEIDRFNLNNLISVGSINNNGARSAFSNYGNAVNIYAPGGNILSTVPGNRYESWNGTSMAAPHVSGVAALIWSMNPNLSTQQVRNAILEGSIPITVNTPMGQQATRRLNAIEALAVAANAPNAAGLGVVARYGTVPYQWDIEITNGNAEMVTITYNERMCFEGDARNFHHLNHLRSFKLPVNGQRTVRINGFGTAGHIAVSVDFLMPNRTLIRRIAFANGLSPNGLNPPQHMTISGGALGNADLVPNYLGFEIVARHGIVPYEWDIRFVNSNPVAVSVTYNYRMCHDQDSFYFRNLRHLADITVPANGSSVVRISGNGTAGYITAAINFYVDGVRYRRISSANGLSPNGLNPRRQNEVVVNPTFPDVPSHPSHLTLTPTARYGFLVYDWDIRIKNNSYFALQVSYNSKMCFEGDARDFEYLNHIVTITIPANGSTTVRITANGTAGWIAACINYSYNGDEYRRITYANGIAVNKTNPPKYNEIRFIF